MRGVPSYGLRSSDESRQFRGEWYQWLLSSANLAQNGAESTLADTSLARLGRTLSPQMQDSLCPKFTVQVLLPLHISILFFQRDRMKRHLSTSRAAGLTQMHCSPPAVVSFWWEAPSVLQTTVWRYFAPSCWNWRPPLGIFMACVTPNLSALCCTLSLHSPSFPSSSMLVPPEPLPVHCCRVWWCHPLHPGDYCWWCSVSLILVEACTLVGLNLCSAARHLPAVFIASISASKAQMLQILGCPPEPSPHITQVVSSLVSVSSPWLAVAMGTASSGTMPPVMSS